MNINADEVSQEYVMSKFASERDLRAAMVAEIVELRTQIAAVQQYAGQQIKPPMRHISGVSLDVLKRAAEAATQPPQDERGQGLKPCGYISTSGESTMCRKCGQVHADQIFAEPAQPVALSTLTDMQLAAAAYDGYDDYWTEDSKGIQTGAWAASAKAVLALAASAPAQQATAPQPVAAEIAKAKRYDWLKARLLCAAFQYGEPSETCSALVFEIPEYMRVSANLDETIDAALSGTGSDESAA